MTDDELRLWGEQEHRDRLVHLEMVRRGEMSLREARRFADIRRKHAGLTSAQSSRATRLAGTKRRAFELYQTQGEK